MKEQNNLHYSCTFHFQERFSLIVLSLLFKHQIYFESYLY